MLRHPHAVLDVFQWSKATAPMAVARSDNDFYPLRKAPLMSGLQAANAVLGRELNEDVQGRGLC